MVLVQIQEKLGEKSIFFALKGGNFNGNEFAKLALEKGAIILPL